MDAFHNALIKAKETDSKWVAEIIVKQKDGSCVDIVPLLGNQSNPKFNSSFPKRTSFLFEDFVGIEDSQKLTTNLINAAMKSGTSIVVARKSKEKSKFRLMTIDFACVRNRLSRPKTKRIFSDAFSQQPCTFIQQSHGSSSVKGKSRSKSNRLCHLPEKLPAHNGIENVVIQKRKYNSVRPNVIDQKCPFKFTIICAKEDKKWYLVNNYKNNTDTEYHFNHPPLHYDHKAIKSNHLSLNITDFMKKCVNEQMAIPRIISIVKEMFNETVSKHSIEGIRNVEINNITNEVSKSPAGTAVDQLIAQFSVMTDVSFIYVKHDMNSGFVTYKKNKNSTVNSFPSSDEYTSVYKADVDLWRKKLEISGSKQLLVAFAWCHDDEFRMTKMFPEFLACDVTFGVNKEQRNLFLLVGVDGSNKVFTAFHCFMQSKQMRAYSWALIVAARHLLTDNVLELNSCLACDGESAMFGPLRSMMRNKSGCFAFSKNRLDKFHLFEKEWKDNVICKVGRDCDSIKILETLHGLLSKIFDHVESANELIELQRCYKEYFRNNKKDLKSEHVCKSIEDIYGSIINNIEYVAHNIFKDVTTLDFVGDSIVEAANSSIKNGSLSCSSNMSLDTSAVVQIKISEKQAIKKNV